MRVLFAVAAVAASAVATPQCGIATTWESAGTLRTRSSSQIQASSFSVGAETMDRNYTIYDNWAQYLPALGAKAARIQGGWARCEKQAGQYDFAWLDEVVNGMTAAGVQPWLQFSYGNPIYPQSGNASSNSALPQLMQLFNNWVAAAVQRYAAQISVFEVWNEANNFGFPAADLATFTAQVVSAVQDSAGPRPISVRFGVLAGTDVGYAKELLGNLSLIPQALGMLDVLTYHPYDYNPDSSYEAVAELLQLVREADPHLRIAQGENGAPSLPNTYGALGAYDWTQCSQAKWFSRRLIGDAARGIPSNAFTIVDICYEGSDGQPELNSKGLIEAMCPNKTAVAPKLAYYTVQRIFSTFDSSLQPLQPEARVNAAPGSPLSSDNATITITPHGASLLPPQVYGAAWSTASGGLLLSVWNSTGTPLNADNSSTVLADVQLQVSCDISNGASVCATRTSNAPSLALLDPLTGLLYTVPPAAIQQRISKSSITLSISGVPLSDFAVMIADAALLPIAG